MNNTGITDDQILKIAIRKIFQDDFAELKHEIQHLREEIARLSSLTNQNELLTMDELCAELKLSKPSVYKLIREKKKIKPIQLLNQDFRFKRADVNQLIENSYKEIDDHLNTWCTQKGIPDFWLHNIFNIKNYGALKLPIAKFY